MSGAAAKSEKPTPKRLRDAAKKGQTLKAKDLVISCLMIGGIGYLVTDMALIEVMTMYRRAIASGFELDGQTYALALLWIALRSVLPVLLVCILAGAVPALLQTGMALAMEAFKLNLGAVNPVNGFKKLFSLRTVKDLIKAMLYLAGFVVAGWSVWRMERQKVFAQLHASPLELFQVWADLLLTVVLVFLGCIALIVALDTLCEYWLHIRELKMDKQEVKRETKEQEGNPEVKMRRRDLHRELLSEQVKSDVAGSRVIIANPTHIAVGIYFRPEVTLMPFISVIETNQRALAVRAYAEKKGVPVVTDVPLARSLFRSGQRYSFVQGDEIEQVLRLLAWLEQVEQA